MSLIKSVLIDRRVWRSGRAPVSHHVGPVVDFPASHHSKHYKVQPVSGFDCSSVPDKPFRIQTH
jgi:hypothetical protein